MQRILVIDDDPAVTSLLKRGLSYEGFAVDTAKSGVEGLVIARDCPSDLVILDVMMPGMGGFEVLQRLRAADDNLPVLMLTAKDAPNDQVQGLEAGADDYMIKPFTFEVLLARVRSLLRRQRLDHSPVLRFADLTLDTGSHSVHRGQREVPLTSLEFKVLQQMTTALSSLSPRASLFNWLSHGGNKTESFSKGKYISATRTVSLLPEGCDCFVWAQQVPVMQL